ncbi:MAG: hypothetical protein ACLFU6_14670, partial [Candidatus Hydrogenedentota bacterium]
GTQIAPGGRLLLGVNKFDSAPGWKDGVVYNNGIGLARGDGLDGVTFQDVTVPPMPDTNFPEFGESVFDRRGFDTDFVDVTGNGQLDEGTAEDLIQSTPPHPWEPDIPNKPWDRIVELRVPALEDVDLSGIARLVLNGGVFPNTPERDGIDNDGTQSELARDQVDNNGYELVTDSPFAAALDEFVSDFLVPEDNPFLPDDWFEIRPEGIDTGRFWIDRWYEIWEETAASGAVPEVAAPGTFNSVPAPFTIGFPDDLEDLLIADPELETAVFWGTQEGFEYLGNEVTPLDWKNQIERRWYPGDRAVITLYEGPAFRQRVVDEITYSEWDIINRSPDNGVNAFDFGRVSLNGNYPTLWPPNTMGQDFYKTLERTHPLYHGDTVGRTNRWQATDGAYDDWAPNMGAYTRVEDPEGSGNFVPVHWFDLGEEPAVRRYGHAMSGSPLRPNITQRLIEQREFHDPDDEWEHPNMPHLATSMNWDDGLAPYTRVVDTPEDLWWAFDEASLQHEAYTGPGDLMGVPYFATARRNPNNADLPFGGTRADGALVGQKYTDDLAAITNNFAPDSIQLTAAQAEFEPVLPTAEDIADDPELAEWQATELPQAWRPVHLFELLGDDALPEDMAHDEPFEPFYLFEPPPADALPEDPLFREGEPDLPRWPLEDRRVMFVSGNLDGFQADPSAEDDRDTIPAAEAFFHWGAEDGLVNGEYDVYLAVAEDLDPVRRADLELRAWSVNEGLGEESLLTPEGQAFMETEAATEQVDIALDAQLFTDQQGDLVNPRWSDPDVDPELEPVNAGDGFGELRGLQPDSDGLVRLGTVRVENNYLGLHLRNWTPRNRLARFSRV